MDLQHHRQRPAEGGPDRRSADRVDRLGRVRRRRAAGQLVGRVRGLRMRRARAPTRSCRSGRGGSSRSTTRATTARCSPAWPGPWPTRPATSGSPTTSSSSPRRRPRSTSSASSTTRTTTRGKDGPYQVDRAAGRRIRRRAGRGADALPHLSARAVLGADPRLDPVLHRLRPAAPATATSPRRSSTARTWSCIARRSRPRPTCPT